MREWSMMLAPVATVIYFIAFPDQFNALLAWAARFIH